MKMIITKLWCRQHLLHSAPLPTRSGDCKSKEDGKHLTSSQNKEKSVRVLIANPDGSLSDAPDGGRSDLHLVHRLGLAHYDTAPASAAAEHDDAHPLTMEVLDRLLSQPNNSSCVSISLASFPWIAVPRGIQHFV